MNVAAPQLLRASAGTGKTYALVEEYVRLVQQEGLSPARIVAITFTRKAAAELTRKIDLRMRQAGVSQSVLAELARAPIGNFHGLALRWLEADGWLGDGQKVGETLGEREDETLFKLSAHNAWLGAGSVVGADVEHVAESCRIDEETMASLWNAIKRAREYDRPIDASLFGLPYDHQAFGQRAQATMRSLLDTMAQAAQSPGVLTTPKSKEAAARVLSLPAPIHFEASERWRAQWQAVWDSVNLGTQLKRVISKQERDEAKALVGLCAAEQACEALQARWARLLGAAWASYVREKQQRGVLDFSDLLSLVVGRMQQSADVHARVRDQVQAVLVDEAQDVSPIQRTLLHLLMGRVGPASTLSPPARLFVVGDGKQCIYAFRGADAHMFSRISEDVMQAGGDARTLTVNYRSRPAVLEGINAIGRHLFAEHYDAIEAAPDVARNALGALGGALGWWSVDDDAAQQTEKATTVRAEAQATACLIREAIENGQEPGRIAILCRILSTHASALVRALSDQGIPSVVVASGSLFEQSDVREWLSLGAWLSAPSKEMDLPLAIALRSPWFAVSDDALFALLGPGGRKTGALEAFARGDAAPWVESLPASLAATQADALRALATRWRLASDDFCRLPVTQSLEWLDRELGITERAWGFARTPQLLANWHQLLAMAERDEARGETHARAFWLRQYQRMRAKEYEAEGRVFSRAHNAVTIASVHSAKGLEWDHVILPLLGKRSRTDTAPLLFDAEDGLVFMVRTVRGALHSERFLRVRKRRVDGEAEEIKRLLYVATTRARTRVDFVAAARPHQRSGHFLEHLVPLAEAAPAWLQHGRALPAARAEPWVARELSDEAIRLPHNPEQASRVLRGSVSAWLDRIGADEPSGAQEAATPSEAFDEQARLQAHHEQQLRAQRGIVAHAALAHVLERRNQKNTTPSEWARLVQQIAWRQGFEATEPGLKALPAALEELTSDPMWRALVALPRGELACEWPFRLRDVREEGVVDLEGTADVIARLDGTLWVIDWKWRKKPPAGRRHRLQVGAYALAARRALGFDGPIRCAAVYALGAPQSRWLSWDFDAKAEAECERALHGALSAP